MVASKVSARCLDKQHLIELNREGAMGDSLWAIPYAFYPSTGDSGFHHRN